MLKNKVIILTGGSGLLGESFANEIISEGGIVINVDITEGKGEFIYTDITDDLSIDNMLAEVIAKYGRIDGLINNAYPRTNDWGCKFEDIPIESWRRNVDMQMTGIFYLSQQLCDYIVTNDFSCSIVNIASIYGVVGNDFTVYEGTELTSPAAYAFIKGGLVNFTKYMASYYGKKGIRVNTVSPGGIFNHQPEKFVKNYEKKVPLGRLGSPEDIAPAVSFLLSEKARYITGHNLVVDGGWTTI